MLDHVAVTVKSLSSYIYVYSPIINLKVIQSLCCKQTMLTYVGVYANKMAATSLLMVYSGPLHPRRCHTVSVYTSMYTCSASDLKGQCVGIEAVQFHVISIIA